MCYEEVFFEFHETQKRKEAFTKKNTKSLTNPDLRDI